MLNLIIFLFLFIFVLNFAFRRFNNPYKLYMVFGKKGSGKSSFLAKKALFYLKRRWVVYSNMSDLHVPGVRLIDARDLGEFVPEPHSVVLFDEVGMLYDNRNYKEFKAPVRDFFKLQRHYRCIVYLASQSYDVDKKLRDLTDDMCLTTKLFPWLGLVRPIVKRIGLVEASSQGESRIVDNLKFRWIFSWRFTFLPRYARYFDSFNLPEHSYLPYSEVSVGSSDLKSRDAEHTCRASIVRFIGQLRRSRPRSGVHSSDK